jgi:hypothetical protein
MEPSVSSDIGIKKTDNKSVQINKKLMFDFLPCLAECTISNPIDNFINLENCCVERFQFGFDR